MQYNHQIMGQVIRNLRKEKSLSQEILSGLSGIARTHLCMIEKGEKNPNLITLWRISQALDVRLSVLIMRVENEMEKKENDLHFDV